MPASCVARATIVLKHGFQVERRADGLADLAQRLQFSY